MLDILRKENFDIIQILFNGEIFSIVPKEKISEFKVYDIKKSSYFDPNENKRIEYNVDTKLILILDKEYCSNADIYDLWEESKLKNFNIEDMLFQKKIVGIKILKNNQIIDEYKIDWDITRKERNFKEHEKIIENKIVIEIDDKKENGNKGDKSMNVYRLEVEAYDESYGSLKGKYDFYTDVYASFERAFKDGMYYLKDIMYRVYENSGYCTKEDSLTLEDMIADKSIEYRFQITEVDPVYAENFDEFYSEKECILNHKPTHIIYNYDYKGNLEYKQIQWTVGGEHHSGQVILQYPGDEKEDAGEKFKIGDFVQIDGEDGIYIVYGTPLKENGKLLSENKYFLSTIIDNKLFPYEESYEYKLKKYDGDIKEDSPYMFLKKIYTKEIDIPAELIIKLENGEIVLNENPSFRDIKI